MSKIGGNRRRGNAWERQCIGLIADTLSLIPYSNSCSNYNIVSARQESRSEDAQLRDICFRNLNNSRLHQLLKRFHIQCKTESCNTNKINFSIDDLDTTKEYCSSSSIPLLFKQITIPTKKTERKLGGVVILYRKDLLDICNNISDLNINRKSIVENLSGRNKTAYGYIFKYIER